ncbi:hypothetical protein O9G_003722 [Rozella allomycis CSF55]|uniref:AIG1-type G domain-containing protein n=1 Tax=Rozella allomycis (strain CSF55) TaxID=988480 RepID=A0A075ART9_ROZAC|nr:hypothetical protein O9G_003722 [Rozella allomycis CSF55]|eukprot:EPZ32991.1 hypothetical protein O9G_003722 [Rozella allomycis CSF55]
MWIFFPFIFILLVGVNIAIPVDSICHKPLNVVILGSPGSGKSSLVDVLDNKCDLKPSNREIKENKMSIQECSFGDLKLRVAGTLGLKDGSSEQGVETAIKISGALIENYPDGVDTILYLVPVWALQENIKSVFNNVNLLISKDVFEHIVFIFTFADSILRNDGVEEEYIKEFKSKMLEFAPHSSKFINSSGFLFYRHYATFEGNNVMTFTESRKRFVAMAYEEIYKRCLSNNGKKYDANEFKEALELYKKKTVEIETLKQQRQELLARYEATQKNIIEFSIDLIKRSKKIKALRPSSFEIANDKSSEETLRLEKVFDSETITLKDEITQFEHLKNQLQTLEKKVTNFRLDIGKSIVTFNNALEKLRNRINKIESIKLQNFYFDNRYEESGLKTVEFFVRDSKYKKLEFEFSKALQFFKSHFKGKLELLENALVIPELTALKPTYADYLHHFNLLKEFEENLDAKMREIETIIREMETVEVQDYPGNAVILDLARQLDEIDTILNVNQNRISYVNYFTRLNVIRDPNSTNTCCIL